MPRVGNNFFDELMVVLVLYKMEVHESPTVISLTTALQSIQQRSSIFIYDNSPHEHRYKLNELWATTYRHNSNNPGVSKAYNEGFKCAKAQNKTWMLLVDQDTVFPVNSFDEYQKTMVKFNCPIIIPQLADQTAIVSPLKFYLGGGQRLSEVRKDRPLNLSEFFFHNSGLLISIDEFEKAGMYDERFPLDFSDFSFVCRLRRHNQFFAVANVIATHHLAATSPANMSDRLKRFQSYLNAARCFKNNYRPSDWMISFRASLRAIKLSLEFKNFQFIVSYFRQHD